MRLREKDGGDLFRLNDKPVILRRSHSSGGRSRLVASDVYTTYTRCRARLLLKLFRSDGAALLREDHIDFLY